MSKDTFENEVLQRLVRIETNQANITNECSPCRKKIDNLEIAVARIEVSAKSAHHRIDAMQTTSNQLKKDLSEAIKEQIDGIYRMAMFLGALSGFFIGVLMWLLK